MTPEYIDRNEVLKIIKENRHSFMTLKQLQTFIGKIHEIPEANVESVVRCKDCIMFDKRKSVITGAMKTMCCLHDNTVKENDFCSYATSSRKWDPIEEVEEPTGNE